MKKIILALENTKSLPLLLIRIILGIIFIQTGWGKLTHFSDTVLFFAGLGIPFPAINAAIAFSTELIGGVCLVIGFATRLVSIPLAFVMVIAIITAQLPNIHGVSELIGLQEVDYFLFFALFIFTGAGRVSVDGLISRSLDNNM